MMARCQTKHDFQAHVIYPLMKPLIERTTSGLTGWGWENLSRDLGYLYISNHRDIVLDAAFLNILFFEQEMPTTEIAIGDNLLVYPWIEDLVRLNKSFIVKRGVSIRQMLEVSRHLSDYIHDTIARQPIVWIAQREGRAKDSDDKTQESLLKMLTLHDSATRWKHCGNYVLFPFYLVRVRPVRLPEGEGVSIEKGPADHKKTQADDIENMITESKGTKGRWSFDLENALTRNWN